MPEQLPEGIVIAYGDSFLKIEVCADDIIRVAHAKDHAFFNRSSLVVKKRPASTPQWHYAVEDGSATVRTARLQVRVDLATGGISFLDAHGRPILAEAPGTRRLEPAEVQGEKTWHVRQAWTSNSGEALYGLGQNQLGLLNLKGYDLDLWQHNSTTVVPFLVSTRGYGLLWDNLSFTRFGDLRESTPIPATQLFDADGRPGGLTASYFSDAHFDKEVAHRTETRIDIDVPKTVTKPNRSVHPDLPEEGDCSVAGRAMCNPPKPAITFSRVTRTATSNCGSTASWS